MRTDVVSNTVAARSIFNGAVKTLARTGDRFRYRFSVSNTSNRESYPIRAALKALRSDLSGQANRVFVGNPSYAMRGVFPCSEMLANNYFASGSASWSVGSGWALTVSDGIAKLTATSATPATTALSQSITLTSGIAYAVRTLSLAGYGTTQPGAVLGSILNSSGAPGMYTAYGTAGSTGAQSVGVYHTIPGGFAAGRTFFAPWTSCQRCALVNGASQTGNALLIDALPISTNGLALAGDIVQIGTQLAMVTRSLDSDSSGAGYLQFKPSLRASPADNSPIIFGYPLGRFVAVSNESGWTDSPGGFSDLDFEFEEALDQ
jgi:hypothetical protein